VGDDFRPPTSHYQRGTARVGADGDYNFKFCRCGWSCRTFLCCRWRHLRGNSCVQLCRFFDYRQHLDFSRGWGNYDFLVGREKFFGLPKKGYGFILYIVIRMVFDNDLCFQDTRLWSNWRIDIGAWHDTHPKKAFTRVMATDEANLPNERTLDWFFHVFRPISMLNVLLDKDYQNRSGQLFYKFWLFPIVLSLFVKAIIFYSFGVDVESHKAISVLTLAFDTFELFAECFILYLLLLIINPRVRVGKVFVCYTIIVTFSPVLTLLAAPDTYYRIAVLKEISDQHLSLAASVKYLLDNAVNLQVTINERIHFPGQFVLGYTSGLVNAGLRVVLAESLIQVLPSERLKTYVLVCIASIISAIPVIISVLGQVWVVYSYIK
jgi:hypothetical protein